MCVCVCVCVWARPPYEPHRSVCVFLFAPNNSGIPDTCECLTARVHSVLQRTRPTETGEQTDWPGDTPPHVVCRSCSHCHTARTAERDFNHAPSVRACRTEAGAANAWSVVTLWSSPRLQRQRPSCPWGRAQRGGALSPWQRSYK